MKNIIIIAAISVAYIIISTVYICRYSTCQADYSRLHMVNDSINALLMNARVKIDAQDSALRIVFASVDTTGQFPPRSRELYMAYRYELALMETDTFSKNK